MIINLLILLVSYIPAILLFIFLSNNRKDDPAYKKDCLRLLGRGALSSFGIALFSMVMNIIGRLTHIGDNNPILWEVYRTFVIAAMVEEIVKYLTAKKMLKEREYKASWLDIISFMAISALGFELLESLIYAIDTNIPQILIRGVLMLHGIYGLIMGYFVGKSYKTGKKIYKYIGIITTMILHGTYNFSLSKDLGDIGTFMALGSVVLAIVILIRMIIFIKKARNNEMYTEVMNLEN